MPSKGSGVQEDAFLAAVIEANTSPMNVDWNNVASLIGYGSAKSASTRFGIIRKRWGSNKLNKRAHVGLHAGKATKIRAPAKGATSRTSGAKPAAPIKKGVIGKGSVGVKGKKLPQKVKGDDDDQKSGHDEEFKDFIAPSDYEEDVEQIKDLVAPSDVVQQDAECDAPKSEKPIRDLMAPSDEEEEEQDQESFQSQVNRGLYAESNAEDDGGNLSDGAVELLSRQIAQQQEAQLLAQMQQRIGQQGVYEEYNAYEPGAVYPNAQDEGQYHGHMAQGALTYYK